MNWVDIVVIVIIGSAMYTGWKKGLIYAIIEFFKWIVAVIIGKLFHVQFTAFLVKIFGDPTPKISKQVSQYLLKKLQLQSGVDAPMGQEQMDQAVGVLKIPMGFADKIKDSLHDKVAATTTDFVNTVSAQMSEMILNALGFIALVLFVVALLSFLQIFSQFLSKLPVIHTFNNGGGLIVGSALGVVSVYFGMTMLTYLSVFNWADQILNAVEKSQFAIYFYKYNILQYAFQYMVFKLK